MSDKTIVELENERVRVTRVRRSGKGSVPSGDRQDRLVIYLQDADIKRTVAARHETIHRRAGEVVWRARSQHGVEVLNDGEHEVLIVELK